MGNATGKSENMVPQPALRALSDEVNSEEQINSDVRESITSSTEGSIVNSENKLPYKRSERVGLVRSRRRSSLGAPAVLLHHESDLCSQTEDPFETDAEREQNSSTAMLNLSANLQANLPVEVSYEMLCPHHEVVNVVEAMLEEIVKCALDKKAVEQHGRDIKNECHDEHKKVPVEAQNVEEVSQEVDSGHINKQNREGKLSVSSAEAAVNTAKQSCPVADPTPGSTAAAACYRCQLSTSASLPTGGFPTNHTEISHVCNKSFCVSEGSVNEQHNSRQHYSVMSNQSQNGVSGVKGAVDESECALLAHAHMQSNSMYFENEEQVMSSIESCLAWLVNTVDFLLHVEEHVVFVNPDVYACVCDIVQSVESNRHVPRNNKQEISKSVSKTESTHGNTALHARVDSPSSGDGPFEELVKVDCLHNQLSCLAESMINSAILNAFCAIKCGKLDTESEVRLLADPLVNALPPQEVNNISECGSRTTEMDLKKKLLLQHMLSNHCIAEQVNLKYPDTEVSFKAEGLVETQRPVTESSNQSTGNLDIQNSADKNVEPCQTSDDDAENTDEKKNVPFLQINEEFLEEVDNESSQSKEAPNSVNETCENEDELTASSEIDTTSVQVNDIDISSDNTTAQKQETLDKDKNYSNADSSPESVDEKSIPTSQCLPETDLETEIPSSLSSQKTKSDDEGATIDTIQDDNAYEGQCTEEVLPSKDETKDLENIDIIPNSCDLHMDEQSTLLSVQDRESQLVKKGEHVYHLKQQELATKGLWATKTGAASVSSSSSYSSQAGHANSTRTDGFNEIAVDRTDMSLQDMKNCLNEMEDKYRRAMLQIAQLDNERTQLHYQSQQLQDLMEEQEEELYRLRKEHKKTCQDVEHQKQVNATLQRKLYDLQETLRQRDELIQELEVRMKVCNTSECDVMELKDTIQWKDKKIEALNRLLNFSKFTKSSNCIKDEQGLVLVGGENSSNHTSEDGHGMALVSPEVAELLDAAGGGPLDSRLRHLLDEKQNLEDQVRRLQAEVYEERQQRAHSTDYSSAEIAENGLNEMQLLEVQREANKQVNEYKLKLQKSEQELVAFHGNVARLESQLQRYKQSSEVYEKNEDEMRAEKRKLMRDLRTALDRIEEMEMTNSHLEKRLERIRASRTAISGQT